jgi:hypothetical protein
MRSKANTKKSSFCLICTRETAITDYLWRFISVAQANSFDDEIVWKNEWFTAFQTAPPRSFPKVSDATSGESIFAEGTKKRIAKPSTSFQHNIAILLEGPTGTSKTESAKDIIARLAADPDRRRAFTLGEGHCWLFDETNMALQTVLQFMEATIHVQRISIPRTVKWLQRHGVPPNYRLIARRNRSEGRFAIKREIFSRKFLSLFTRAEFPEKVATIAVGGYSKVGYRKDRSVSISRMAFHHERSRGEEAKHLNDCFTVRAVALSINVREKFNNRFDEVMSFSGMHSPGEIRGDSVSLLHTKYKSSYCPPNWFVLPGEFRDCLRDAALMEVPRGAVFAFGNGRSILLIGEEGFGLDHGWGWSEASLSGMRSKANAEKSSFCLICTRETAIADCLCRFIPVAKADSGSDEIVWKKEWLAGLVMKGRCCIIASIESAPATANEKSNGDRYVKESGCDLGFGTAKSATNATVELNASFWLIAACTCKYEEVLSRGFLDGVKIVYSEYQVGGLQRSRKWLLMPYIFCSTADASFHWNVLKDGKRPLFSALPDRLKVAWLAKFYRRAAVLSPDCERLEEKESISLVHRFPGADFRLGERGGPT